MDFLGKADVGAAKKKINKGKVLKVSAILIFIILIITIFILYVKNERVRSFFDTYIFRKIINEENVPSIDIENVTNANIFAFSKYIVVLDQNVLNMYNKAGKREHSLDIEISNPIFETSGNYLCIAEKGGQEIYLIENKNIVWQKEIEGEISSINVNKNGYVSVTISGTSYKTVVQTFNSKGDDLFKFYFSTTNVIDTDISNDNKYLAIAEANFSGIVVQSNVKVVSMDDAITNSTESIKYTHIAKANDLIINIKYNNKNDLICMYDEHIDVLKGEENTELVNLVDEKPLFADINLSSNIIKIVKKSEGLLDSSVEMQIINSNNVKEINRYTINGTPKKIYTQGNMIAVNLGTNIMFINSSGWLVKEYGFTQKEEIQNIVMCDGISGIISKNKIYIISL